ncbi:hypothetical protein CBJ86_000218 [Salmonella enterica subsp. enterica serovar Gateshead]|nr:hypothetical protein [Salmonella enterica subsp. enterica serovar Gateshead]
MSRKSKYAALAALVVFTALIAVAVAGGLRWGTVTAGAYLLATFLASYLAGSRAYRKTDRRVQWR